MRITITIVVGDASNVTITSARGYNYRNVSDSTPNPPRLSVAFAGTLKMHRASSNTWAATTSNQKVLDVFMDTGRMTVVACAHNDAGSSSQQFLLLMQGAPIPPNE